jgi:DNA-binding transcriptional regulator GbsR (MarR family)
MEAILNEVIPSPDIDDEIKALYLDPSGYTYNEIAERLGVSITRVQKRLKAMQARGEVEYNRGKGFRRAPAPSSFHTP